MEESHSDKKNDIPQSSFSLKDNSLVRQMVDKSELPAAHIWGL